MIEYQQLSHVLDKLLQLYRQLLGVIQSEEKILASSNLESLKESNQAKEKVVQKVSEIEVELNKIYTRIANQLKLTEKKPSLLLLTRAVKEKEWAVKFENYHKVFEILVNDLTSLNKKNAAMIESAQVHVQGAMDAIREAIAEPTNYELSGKIDEKPKSSAGSFINRQA